MTKKKLISKNMKITLASLLVGSIACFTIAGTTLYNSNYKLSNYFDINNLESSLFYNNNQPFGNAVYSSSQDIANIENINLQFDSDTALIESYNGSSIEISLYSTNNSQSSLNESSPLSITSDNKTLTIKPDTTVISSSDLGNYQFRIKIPNSYSHNLNISSHSGNIDFNSMNLNDLNFKTSNTSISLNNITCNNSKFNIKNNSLTTKNFITKDLSVSAVGSYVYASGLSGNVAIDSIDGDFYCTLTNNLTSLTASVNSANINLNLPHDGNFEITSSVINGYFSNNLSNNNSHNNDDTPKVASPVTLGGGDNKIKLNVIDGSIHLNK